MKPRLLDLFCGAGGAAKGYADAGFEVVGVDIKPQPHYPYPLQFIQDDALHYVEHPSPDWIAANFDAIHASPPCQAFSTIAKQQRQRRPGAYEHPDLVEPTRKLLRATGLPYVIENVMGASLENPIMLCGSGFGMDIRRHRLFEVNFPVMAPGCAHGQQAPRFRSLDQRRGNKSVVPVHGGSQLASVVGVHGHINYAGEMELREKAMGIDWMTPHELTQAIPPAYTEHIGGYLMTHLQAVAA